MFSDRELNSDVGFKGVWHRGLRAVKGCMPLTSCLTSTVKLQDLRIRESSKNQISSPRTSQ